MQSILHALNIGTLATWLSVAGAGTVALVVKTGDSIGEQSKEVLKGPQEGSEVMMDLEQLSAGSAPSVDASVEEEAQSAESSEAPLEAVEPLPELPPLPELADVSPLPELPELPKNDRREAEQQAAPKPASKPAAASSSSRGTPKPSSSAQSGAGAGRGSGNAAGGGSGQVGAARWAGGRMPAPNYPSEARRNGQQGRVVVLFSVDEQGNVVSARVTSPCPYPLLNEEALRAVRRWKFQPGVRASLQRPIIFKLN